MCDYYEGWVMDEMAAINDRDYLKYCEMFKNGNMSEWAPYQKRDQKAVRKLAEQHIRYKVRFWKQTRENNV